MTDIDPIDYEYFVEKTEEYKAMRAKLRELVAELGLQYTYSCACYREALGDCIRDIEKLLEVK